MVLNGDNMGVKDDLDELKAEYEKGDMSKNEYLKQKADLEHKASQHSSRTSHSNNPMWHSIKELSIYGVIILIILSLYLNSVVGNDNNIVNNDNFQISSLQSSLSKANSTISSQDSTISSQARMLDSDNNTMYAQINMINSKSITISNDNNTIAQLQTELSNSGSSQSSLNNQLNSVENQLSITQSQINTLQSNINMQNTVVILQKTSGDIVLSNGNSYTVNINPKYSGFIVLNMTYPNSWSVKLTTPVFPTISATYNSGTNLLVYLPAIADQQYTLTISDACVFGCSQYTGNLWINLLN